MRTPKRLYAEERIIYRPELLTCLHCGDLLVLWNYLAWAKIVQTLDRQQFPLGLQAQYSLGELHWPFVNIDAKILPDVNDVMFSDGVSHGHGCSQSPQASLC